MAVYISVLNENKIKIEFEYTKMRVEKIKKVPGRRYEPERKYWTIPYDSKSLIYILRLFKNEKVPLHNTTSTIKLKNIDEVQFHEHFKYIFHNQNVNINQSTIARLYEYIEGLPYYITKCYEILHHRLVSENRNTITSTDIDYTIDLLMTDLDTIFETNILYTLSQQQKSILKYMSIERHRKIGDVAKCMGTSSTSLTSSINDLLDRMIISKTKKGYYCINDNIFRLWLKMNTYYSA
ncbi:MAG: hypothetical protein ACOCQN_00500, partial [Halanaerobiaceae bacterium]